MTRDRFIIQTVLEIGGALWQEYINYIFNSFSDVQIYLMEEQNQLSNFFKPNITNNEEKLINKIIGAGNKWLDAYKSFFDNYYSIIITEDISGTDKETYQNINKDITEYLNKGKDELAKIFFENTDSLDMYYLSRLRQYIVQALINKVQEYYPQAICMYNPIIRNYIRILKIIDVINDIYFKFLGPNKDSYNKYSISQYLKNEDILIIFDLDNNTNIKLLFNQELLYNNFVEYFHEITNKFHTVNNITYDKNETKTILLDKLFQDDNMQSYIDNDDNDDNDINKFILLNLYVLYMNSPQLDYIKAEPKTIKPENMINIELPNISHDNDDNQDKNTIINYISKIKTNKIEELNTRIMV